MTNILLVVRKNNNECTDSFIIRLENNIALGDEEFDIDPETLDWKPFPFDQQIERSITMRSTPSLTIEEAKQGIAKKLGIDPDCIEITIRA